MATAVVVVTQGAEQVLYRVNCGHDGFVVDAHGGLWTGDATMRAGGETVKASRWTTVNYALTPETAPYAAIFDMERYVQCGRSCVHSLSLTSLPSVAPIP